ncbi:MAG TPA: hypothetical protein VFE47_28490 [Tepidisphaeraceae bacterium]|jgi:hypothetical protein|nr:hypothetical protein [Tepidisphaeraceae bacterium]
MRKSFSFVAVALAMVLCTYAMGADATAPKPLHGKVTAVAKDSITISSRPKTKGDAPVETVIKIDDSTKVTKAGAAATIADVVVGSNVSVTLGDTGKPAVSIDIRAGKKKPAKT